nr:hypothetical protein [Streptomyces lienomycini]
MLLRLDPQVYEALARWAGDELRSANAQIEFVLRRALAEAGRLPRETGPLPRRGARRGAATLRRGPRHRRDRASQAAPPQSGGGAASAVAEP